MVVYGDVAVRVGVAAVVVVLWREWSWCGGGSGRGGGHIYGGFGGVVVGGGGGGAAVF